MRLLFLSRIHPKKQLENLLDALALLQQRSPGACWELTIAGDGDARYVSSLKERTSTLGIDARCRWLGFVEGATKWQVLQQADWYVLPSAAENFGIAAVEALAAGTPVILSTGGGRGRRGGPQRGGARQRQRSRSPFDGPGEGPGAAIPVNAGRSP